MTEVVRRVFGPMDTPDGKVEVFIHPTDPRPNLTVCLDGQILYQLEYEPRKQSLMTYVFSRRNETPIEVNASSDRVFIPKEWRGEIVREIK